VLATTASTETGHLREAGQGAVAALNGGFHLAYVIGAALVAVAIVIATVVLRSEREPRGERQPEPTARLAESCAN
jgi:hypothetical protein